MITYKDIESVNRALNFTDVKGKMYAEVPQRVKAFRTLFPQGFIITEFVAIDNGVCIMKATAGYYDESGKQIILGTGTAYEKENSSYINKTSYIENCETSAVGRALGFIGLGSETSIASAEEVANAINNQEKPAEKQIKADESEAAFPVCEDCGRPIKDIVTKSGTQYTAQQLIDLSKKTYGKCLCYECASAASKARTA